MIYEMLGLEADSYHCIFFRELRARSVIDLLVDLAFDAAVPAQRYAIAIATVARDSHC